MRPSPAYGGPAYGGPTHGGPAYGGPAYGRKRLHKAPPIRGRPPHFVWLGPTTAIDKL